MDRILWRLQRLCAAEKAVLLSGQYDRLAEIEAIKTQLLVALQNNLAQADPRALARLKAAARENDRLYQASITGIRTVKEQVSRLISGGAELKTYGAGGQRNALAPNTGTVRKRA